ncbi:hypothetical protein WA1_18700 [Scytonema hofmannii PCC 7110]|uniref:Uncharacterized protein n=2 Tax=Scytonema hofmannii TaxID=34078 RepID=A0A139XBG2_9CYAN|nr:hypothetical protein WA1_18700 [Scytonema hofmannii PCC 7110]
MNAIASQANPTHPPEPQSLPVAVYPPEFLEFWAKHEGTFPGYANGSQIEDLCKQIALEAWLANQRLGIENFEDSAKLSRKFPR